MKNTITLLLISALSVMLSAQDLNQYTLSLQYRAPSASSLVPADSLNHSSLRDLYPFTRQVPDQPAGGTWHNRLYNKVFHENLVIIKRPGFFITADPLFDAGVGRETVAEQNTWVNTRGVQAYGKIFTSTPDHGPTVEFYTSYYESQAVFPGYIDSLSRVAGGVPGQGSFRRKGGGWDFGYATGWLRFKPNKYFTFEAGTGKNFFGNGYRSMLLSDNSRNAPYFRIDTRIWRIHYTNLWSEYQDNRYKDGPQGAFQKKYGAFHYLSYAITNRLELSFFEAVIWQGRDSLHTRGFDVNYLNPVILYRPVEWTMGSPDNALMGLNLSYQLLDKTYLYGQFIIDEFSVSHMKEKDGWWGNKYAGQIGAKGFIPIGTTAEPRHPSLVTRHSLRGIFLQSELNFARPYTFSHWTTKQNYGHLGQPIGHPLGANFIEWVSFARLHLNRFTVEGRYSLAKYGANYDGLNYGQDIFIPYTSHVNELGNFIGQGLATTLTYKTLTCSYLLNPASLLNVFASVTQRNQSGGEGALWFSFGVRNSLRNLYYDY